MYWVRKKKGDKILDFIESPRFGTVKRGTLKNMLDLISH